MLEESERLRGQTKNRVHAEFFRDGFGADGELGADATMFVCRINLETGQLRFFVGGVGRDGNAADDVVVDFKNEIFGDVFFDDAAGAFQELVAINGGLDECADVTDIFAHGGTNALVFVRVN